MSSFLETPRFPEDISYNSKGGPAYNTTVIQINSGHEKRNINWQYPLCEYDVAYGVRSQSALYVLIEMFHVVAGQGHGFRYKDFNDHKSCTDQLYGTISDTDQLLDLGDSSTVAFQLKKTYTMGAMSRERPIRKPVTGTVVVALDGVPQPTGWTVDTTTGIITFSVAPGTDVEVTAGFEYDIPVRFDSDTLDIKYDNYDIQSTSVPLQEIRV